MADKASVTLRGRFPEGTKVGLYARHGDTLRPGAATLATAKVNKDLTVTFSDREQGERLWVAADIDGEFRYVAVTAKEAPRQKTRVTGQAARERLSQTVFQASDKTVRVTGARSSADIPVVGSKARGRGGQPFSAKNAGEPTPKGELPLEAHPARRIEDAQGEQLASDTITGTAVPAAEHPLRQDQVPDGVPQRSSTPLGEATIIPEGEIEHSPGPRQEDTNGPLQRSDTPHGTATPLPDELQKPKRKTAAKKKAAKKRPAKQATARRKAAATRSRARRGGVPRKGKDKRG